MCSQGYIYAQEELDESHSMHRKMRLLCDAAVRKDAVEWLYIYPIWAGGGGGDTIASQQEGTKLDFHSFKGLHAVPVAVWVSSGYSVFFPQSKTMHWLI